MAKRKSSLCGLSYGSLEPRQLLASIAVVDINQSFRGNLDTDTLVAFNDGLAGVMENGQIGSELWFSNATHDGEYLIDVVPGIASSAPTGLTVVGNQLFFFAFDESQQRHLWVTDGTENGTQKLQNFESFRENGFAYDGSLYFNADDGVHGSELWTSDGTKSGTILVKDIIDGATGSSPDGFVELGDDLYFKARWGDRQYLWKSNGTAKGTEPIVQVDAYGALFANEAAGLLYFEGWSQHTEPDELWVSNGTEPGTMMIATFESLAWNFDQPINFGNSFLFGAKSNGTDWDLWSSDGTASGTQMVADLDSGPGIFSEIHSFVELSNTVYFTLSPPGSGGELWRTDGTPDGTSQVPLVSSVSRELAVFNDQLIYIGYDESVGLELWSTRGTLRSNVVFADIVPGEKSLGFAWSGGSRVLITSGDKVFAAAIGNNGREVWATDGSEISKVTSPPTNTIGSDAYELVDIEGEVYFAVRTWNFYEIYRSDGSIEGTEKVPGLPRFEGGSNRLGRFTELNGNLLFTYRSPNVQTEIWVYDIGAQTFDIIDGVDVAGGSLNVDEGLAYFVQKNSNLDHDIWVTDGTDEGTHEVLEVGARIDDLTIIDGKFFFSSGMEVFASDGTQRGTHSLGVTEFSSTSSNFTRLDTGLVIFTTREQVYVTDGTAVGTTVVAPYVGSFDQLDAIVSVNGNVVYTNEGKLFVTDGTPQGSFELMSGLPAGLQELVVLNNEVYFSANERLFKTDGTTKGTTAVSAESTQPTSMAVFNGKLYFSGSSSDTGRELWVSDGTESGTMMVIDYVPGAGESDVNKLTAAGDNLFFVYDSISTGDEIGFLTIDAIDGVDFGPSGSTPYLNFKPTFDQAYNSQAGYGWTEANGLSAFTLTRGNDLNNDKVSLRNGTFVIDVLNGTYEVNVHLGAVAKTDAIEVSVEGQEDRFTPNAGPNVVRLYTATVADGQLTLEFDGLAGLDNQIRIAGISLNSIGSRPAVSGPSSFTAPTGFENPVRTPENRVKLSKRPAWSGQNPEVRKTSEPSPSLAGSQIQIADELFAADSSILDSLADFEAVEIMFDMPAAHLGRI